jgi:glutaredoxin 3
MSGFAHHTHTHTTDTCAFFLASIMTSNPTDPPHPAPLPIHLSACIPRASFPPALPPTLSPSLPLCMRASRSAGNYDQAATRTTLEKLVADDDVVIFSATYCPFSLAAKRTLAGQGVDFQAYEWNTRPDGAALVAELGVLTGRTSIPHIFIGGKSIGGFNDGTPGLRPLINSGQFDETVLQSKTRRAAGETPAKPLAIFGSSGSASQAPSP